MSKPPEIDRKQLKTPDEFVKKGTEVFGSMVSHRKQILPLGILVFLGAVGFYGYQWWESSRSDKAWKAYYEATKSSEPKKWEDLKNITQQYNQTRPMLFAAVNLADHHFEEAKKAALKENNAIPADATASAEWYSKALEFKALLPNEKQLLFINRAGALEMQKKYDEALASLKSAEELGTDLKGLALLNTGRVLELKGEKQKAIETYEKVGADFLNTEYAKMAKNYARRLKSPLLSSYK